ncbi:LOW QUALITY PROTEIN: high mobility group protein 20A-like [Rhopalosiphum padi]|uniref:LOW QUALITY PROTEIN: high mobility group protein 20A-like n=1 Tax=Rhopalosiphum padi TaxID=40932 RepID=UPI00298DF19B|nr:LOW QUALITY PROTEIN: high mobility group protein 20A-like [Rhopalosiphum padi]
MIQSENTGAVDKSGQDDEFIENGMSKKVDKNNVKGKKRKKYLRDKTAPRPPHSGYIRFLNDRREQFRSENPNLPFAEITKVLATEWNQLPADKKQQYLLAAEQERVKYVEELAAYKKTDAYKNFIQRKLKKKKVNTSIQEYRKLEKERPSNNNSNTVHDIPIYTEEFLNFNKARESELRYLRKTVTDQEQEVSVLDKHIGNMNNGIIKLMANTEKLKAGCSNYEQHLTKLRSLLLDSFSNIAFPDNTEPPTVETIDTFMVDIATFLTTGTNTDLSWIANVKRAISNLDFSQC